MKKLSRPLSALKPSYEVVVIGSGYGGSISASRLARAGLQVCLLEKGKEFQPGEYPDSLGEAEGEMQLNTDGRRARTNGLYDFHVSEDISVFKGCGLGGTSLVNAGVSIEPEDRVLQDGRWPAEIRNDPASLRQGYSLARQMLAPAPYPEATEGYPELAKARAMKRAAEKMNYPFRYADINVSFTDGVNKAGIAHKKCTNCGDCVTGCNHGAKNTLIMNYLPDAYNHGAEIFCNVGVEYVEPSSGGWLVHFNVYGSDRDKFEAPPMFVRAETVIVSGGTLGSTEILLRSREKGLDVSGALGHHFTGNGDVLGFSYNCKDDINGIGLGKCWNDSRYKPVGPCITGIIDMRNQPVLTDGMTFEEGSIPAPIATVVNMAMAPLAQFSGALPAKETERARLSGMMEEAESLLGGPYRGAIRKMQTYLVMTHDDGNGKLELKNDRLDISWPDVGKQPVFEQVRKAMLSSNEALQGVFVRNVVWNKLFNYELITVHPLGGCCMADDAARGVTDHSGNVFRGDSGTATFQGLYVLDGSIVPLPLGTNPLFTISALSERACRLIASRLGREIDYGDHIPAETPGAEPACVVQFTETMKGFVSTGEKEDYEKAYELGKQQGSPCLFTLTIQTGDMNGFLSDPTHAGSMAGTVTLPALSSRPLMVSDGLFNLFVQDPGHPDHLKMKYSMQLNSWEGRTFYFSGYKQIQDDKGPDLWQDTTRLFVTVYEGRDTSGPVAAKGILTIAPHDFAIQMTTLKVLNAATEWDKLKILKEFSSFFGRNLMTTYFKKMF
jgi:cholesterol oxidase